MPNISVALRRYVNLHFTGKKFCGGVCDKDFYRKVCKIATDLYIVPGICNHGNI